MQKRPLEEIYKGAFFKKRNSLAWRAPIVCDTLNSVFEPKTVIDVGCGIGDYVHYWNNELKIGCWGIEGSKNAIPFLLSPHQISICDLRVPLQMRGGYDLVTCLEVAEHIEPKYACQFLMNLASLGDKIVMSAAGPGQGGHHHVNCRPNEYWIERMEDLGYSLGEKEMLTIHQLWKDWQNKKEMSSYYSNLLYFEKRGEDHGGNNEK